MRRLTLAGTFLVLLAALFLLWQYRFERSPEFPTYHLADLRAAASPSPGVEWLGPETLPKLRLRVDQAHPRVVARLDLPEMKAVDLLHLRFQVTASKLRPGKEFWEDGRCLIEWHPQSGGTEWENDPVCSVRHDQATAVAEQVMRPDQAPAIPALRVENLGRTGDLEISVFEASVLQERTVWKIGRCLLMAGWLAWAVAWIGCRGKCGFVRSLFAASIWLVMGIYFVVPGPWKGVRPLGGPLQIGPEIAAFHAAAAPAPVPQNTSRNQPSASPVVLDSVGKIPDQGDFTLRLKHYAKNARSMLHVALLLGPTLLIACLVGRKPARSLAIILALAIEAAQLAFGFGFDWVDVFDLACDAAGIALALTAHRYLQRILPRMAAGEAILPLKR